MTKEEMIKKINELEKSVKALLMAMKSYEEDHLENIMPEGEFLGLEFKDE